MAHPKHDAVRERYGGCCGYCGLSETDTGGGLAVDHFRPLSAGGDEDDGNLVYACFRCNLFKGDFYPNADDVRNGRRLLHPLLDDGTQHMRLVSHTGELEPITETGRFHVQLLQLNRPALVRHRLRRWLWRERQQFLEDELDMLMSTITGLELHVARLERLLHQPRDD